MHHPPQTPTARGRRHNPWRFLTRRGRAFWLIGAAAVLAGILIGQRDVLRIGILLIVVPVLALILVTGARLRLSCRRELTPERVQLGSPLVGKIHLQLDSLLPAGMVLLEDRVPPELGHHPRFTLDRSRMLRTRTVEYPLLGRVRGRWTCGPVTVRTADPFGLVRVDRRFTATTQVLVTPQLVELESMPNGGGRGGAGETRAHRIGVVGTDDILIREYRHGDDVRRVHWPSTARRGELMVRREEQSSTPSIRIILDSRFVAHAGAGIDHSLEWAVSAAASIGVHFLGNGYAVEVFDAGGRLSTEGSAEAPQRISAELLVRRLTELRARRTTTMQYGIHVAAADRHSSLVVAIMGKMSTEEANLVARANPVGSAGVAILLDVDSFAHAQQHDQAPAAAMAGEQVADQPRSATGHGSPEPLLNADSAAAEPGEPAAPLLRENGWQVIRAQHGMSVADVWAGVHHQAAR